MTFARLNSIFIILYLYWVAFEWVILSPLNNFFVIQLVREAIDFIPIIMLILNFMIVDHRIKKVEWFISIGVLLILLIDSLSLMIEGHNPLAVIPNAGVSFRFVPFIILARLVDDCFSENFNKHIRIIFWIQVVLAILEIINKPFFVNTLLPNPEIFSQPLPSSYSTSDLTISTTFINTIDFSFFILAITVIYIFNIDNRKKRVLVYSISFLLIIFSFSIASLLAILIIGFFMISRRRWLFVFCFGLPILILIIFNPNIWIFLSGIDSPNDFIEIANDYNRIGYFTKLLPEFFHGSMKDIIFGIGINQDLINYRLLTYKNLPLMLTTGANNLILLKDVYWISIIVTEGILVFIIHIIFIVLLYRQARIKLQKLRRNMVYVFICFVIFLGFFNQVLDVKSLSFCFWVTIGIVLKETYEYVIPLRAD